MKKKTKKIKEIINSIENSTDTDFIQVDIVFSAKDVYRDHKGFTDIFKKLTNGRNMYKEKENRVWYKESNMSGFYQYIIKNNEIIVTILIDRLINIEEFLSRLDLICKPVYSKITYEVDKLIDIVEIDTSIFGKYRKHENNSILSE